MKQSILESTMTAPRKGPMSGKKQEDQGATHDGALHIKKYGNRRLYAAAETRFVTIQELAQYVRSGRKVRVTDADTGEDITSEILTQILLEGGRAQHLPVELLEKMIQVNEKALQNFWGAYIDQSTKLMETFQENWQSMRKSSLFFQWLGDSASKNTEDFQEPKKRKK